MERCQRERIAATIECRFSRASRKEMKGFKANQLCINNAISNNHHFTVCGQTRISAANFDRATNASHLMECPLCYMIVCIQRRSDLAALLLGPF